MPQTNILPGITRLEEEMVALRRHLHAHPETAFEEFQTSALVAEKLASWGYEVHTGMAITGVVATLRAGSGERSIGLRADMDALPINENTGLPYASRHPGKMHACGHDGHTAILLCAAKHLAEQRNFNGTLHLIFQPAEENEGGARHMIAEGLFQRFPCDAVFALHNIPGIPLGTLAFRAGPAMASFDRVTVTLTGRSAHGAMPHHGIDPMQCAASIVLGLQSLVSREIDAQQAAVITVGSVQAGEVYNIVPEQAVLKIGVRALDPAIRGRIEQRLQEFVRAQAQSYGLQCEIDYRQQYPVLVNHERETAFAREVALEMLGPELVRERAPTMGSEDFAYMLQNVPGCYLFLGNGVGDDGGCMVHNPHYDFNDRALPLGASYWVRLTQAFLR